ncbi:hypothetical protein Mal52_31160 [Symmachiella dynata]|uniref:Uncharacterized protein n=1 Tax=Symmachiella dynata TaxID=2527995 RepID=A0A517ZQ96_9PLAN|nr:hypothetical protein Mal52_31160 [Symmachiella dynata]
MVLEFTAADLSGHLPSFTELLHAQSRCDYQRLDGNDSIRVHNILTEKPLSGVIHPQTHRSLNMHFKVCDDALRSDLTEI